MSEIYWISTIGNLSNAFLAILVISIILLFASGIMAAVNSTQYNKEECRLYQRGMKVCKGTLITIFITILGIVFTPSEKQMYAIYGIGGIIDYVKSNNTAKQLPDKAIKVLDVWLEKQTEKIKDSEE